MSEVVAAAAANVLLDMVTAFDDELMWHDSDGVNDAAMRLAFQRFDEFDAVTLTWDDEEEDPPRLDVSPLVGGTVVSLKWLVGRVAVHSGISEEEVIADLRDFLADHASD